MNESFGGGFTQGAETKTESKSEGILPVFVKMIHLQPEEIMKVYGFEYKMVNIVGVVKNVEHSSTKISYEIEDFTGSIHTHLWVEEGEAPVSANIMINSYVRVVGAVRSQGNTKVIMIFKIQPIKGINELNTHYIEVVNARYQAEEYFNGGKGGGEAASKGTKMEVDAPITGGANQGMKGKELAIFEMVRNADPSKIETGYSRTEIEQRFPHIPPNEIRSSLEKLIYEGHVYTTVDNDHFQACF